MNHKNLPKIMIACPIRNRGKLVPYYLKYLTEMNYPKDKIRYYFLVNDSIDSTEKQLIEFKKQNKNVKIGKINFNDGSGWTRAIQNFYNFKNLAILRNKILKEFRKSDCEYLFSCDSDIMVYPNVLHDLLEANVDICGALIYNSYHINEQGKKDQCYNIMKWDKLRKKYVHFYPQFSGVHECDLTGAVMLISKKVVLKGVKYNENGKLKSGEDESFCMNAQQHKFKIYYNGTAKCFHIMTPKQFENLQKGILIF